MGWEYLVIMLIVSLAVTVALTPKPKAPKPSALEDLDIPVAEENKEIAVIFGTADIEGPTVCWYGDLKITPIRKSGGKKG